MPKLIEFTELEKQNIIDMYKSGVSCKKIGVKYLCSKQTINKLLCNNNIELRDKSHAHQKYTIDENVFENIDTQEKAYWLGMLSGDGWITDKNDFGLSLQESDKHFISLFKIFLKSTHPIGIRSNGFKKDGTESISHELRITNRKIVQDLRKYGFKQNKTKDMIFPEINSEFLPSYLAGLVDSDGSIFLKTHYLKKDVKTLHFNFVGPTAFVEKFQEILIEKCNVSKTKLGIQKSTDFIRVIEYGGYKHIYKIIKYIYSATPVWMPRKKDTAIKFLLTKYPDDLWLINQLKDAICTLEDAPCP